MKIKYLILLAAILFVIGCTQQTVVTPKPTTPTPTPTPTPEPTPVTPVLSNVMIKDRVVTPTELTIAAGTEVAISVEGNTQHIVQVIKAAEGDLGPKITRIGTLKGGDKATYTFTEPGTYTINSLKVGSVSVAVTVK